MSRSTMVVCVVLLAVGDLIVCSSPVEADTLLFADNYNSSSATDGSNLNVGLADRTSGVYSSSNYTIQNLVTLYGTESANFGYLRLSNDSESRGDAIIGHDFYGADSAGGLNIDIRCQPSSDGGDSWTAVVIGHNGTSDPPTINNGLVVAMRGNGGVFIREDEETVATGEFEITNDFHDFHIKITGVGDDNPFDGVGGLNVKVYVDDNTTAGADYTSSVAYTTNYMGLLGNAQTNCRVDSLSISSIPEPKSVVLLMSALMGLACYAWRKRKCVLS